MRPFLAHAPRALRLLLLIVGIVSVADARDLHAQNAEPRAVVATFQDTLLATMKKGESLGFEGRYRRLLPAMDAAFDLPQMTRIVIGGRWSKLSEAERSQVVELFRQFSVSVCASAFSGYDGEQFEIGGERAHPGVGTMVETRLIPRKGEQVALNYLLRESPTGWKIVDVYLAETISELARRRDEFANVIRNHGIDGFIALLKKKNEELAGS